MKPRGRNVHAVTLLCLLLLSPFAAPAAAQGELRASPSAFRLLASGVAYAGVEEFAGEDDESVEWRRDNLKPIVAGGAAYHAAHMVPGLDLEGLAAEDTRAGAWTVYPLFHLAVAAGWYKPEGEDADNNYADAVRGLFLVGDRLWMGSNGVGVLAFDTRRRTWSRHDVKEAPREGRHTTVWHADRGYLFVTVGEFPDARLHVYSMRRERWLRLDAIPARSVRSFGRSGPMAQVGVNHGQFADKEYLPVDWSVAQLDSVTPLEGGEGYLFEKRFTEYSETVFSISGQELEAAFDAAR